MKIVIRTDQNFINQYALLLVLFFDMIYGLLRGVSLFFNAPQNFAYYIFYLISVPLFTIISLKSMRNNQNVDAIRLILALIIVWTVAEFCWAFAARDEIASKSITCLILTISFCVPVFVFTLNADDYDIVIEKSTIFSVLSLIYAVVYFVGLKKGYYTSDDYMSFSYSLMIGCLFSFYRGIVLEKKLSLIFGVALFVILMSLGSRGVLVSTFASAFILFLYKHNLKSFKSIILWLICIFLLAVLILYHDKIIVSLHYLFPNSRTLSIFASDLINGKINLTNRNMYYDYFKRHASDYILFGTGILNDRYIIGQDISRVGHGEDWLGCYMHNFFLEILMQYGFILGTIILAVFAFIFVRAFLSIKYMSASRKGIFLTFVPAIFITYMVSGSYLHSMRFYFMLGLLIVANRSRLIPEVG
jgi:hypothetical protein